jgi:hypothetical protein
VKRIRTPWLALVALAAAACHADEPKPAAAETQKAQTTAAAPILPAAPAPKSTQPVAAVKALPIVPAGGASAAQTSATPKSAAQTSVAADASSREERLTAVKSEFEAAMNAYYEPFRQAKTDEERQKISETTKAPDPAPYRARARALVDEDATDAVAFDALSFLIAEIPAEKEEDVARDIALLGSHHFGSEKMLEALPMLQYSNAPASRALLERLAKESPHRTVRGRGWMALAEALKGDLTKRAQLADMPEGEKSKWFIEYVGGQPEVDRLLALDSAQVDARVLQLYETVARDYADVPAARKGVLGDQAKASIHEMKDLVVGKTAPDIAGEDTAGVAFKLSDYRGKVVLLDFWGNW